MTRDEAQKILLIYRHGTDDANDPSIAAALALAKTDVELAQWLQVHFARQFVLREKFRQITAPAGLKEQIISERTTEIKISERPRFAGMAFALFLLVSAALAVFYFPKSPAADTLAVYQNQMAGVALRGYAMEVVTNDVKVIRDYFAQNRAPSTFAMPAGLAALAPVGCAVENWQDKHVAMVCFQTSQSAGAREADLWLFVVDGATVKNLPAESSQVISSVNRLATATWVQNGKLYFVGTTGDARTLRKLL